MEDFCTLFAKQLKQQRCARCYTAEQFAEKVGISPRHLRAIESGSRKPSLDLMLRIASELHLSLDAFVFPSPERLTAEKRSLMYAVLTSSDMRVRILWKVTLGLQELDD